MKSPLLRAHRATLLAAATLALLAGSPLVSMARAEPAGATSSGAVSAATPTGLALRIGKLSQQLFDAAAASNWTSARTALRALHEQADLLDGVSATGLIMAGGRAENLVSMRNGLRADLAEADIAAGARDAPALSEAANRMTSIAGDLALPFADAPNAAPALKVDTEMFLARRMRIALVAGDAAGFDAAYQQFQRVWAGLRRSLPDLDPAKAAALDQALTLSALSRSAQTASALQQAAQDVLSASARPGR